ncbi:MAG: putative Sco1/SenC family protein [Frankiales bacterium]|nr:putative Sco1/SenC family protein [Frankiales bacterium]
MRALPLVLTAVLLGSLTGCGQDASPKPAAATGYHGVEPLKTVNRPSYVLRDTAGKAFDFRAETKGRPTFVYFGYTNCPDECPTAMADIAAALRKTTPEVRAAARVVFVTTDPKRDTAPVLRRWLDQFSTEFVGLLGTQAQLDAAQRASGIEPGRAEGPVPTIPGRPDQHVHKEGTAPHKHFGPLGYSVSHSAVIFAYNAADRLPVVYPGGVTPSDIAADLPVLARP